MRPSPALGLLIVLCACDGAITGPRAGAGPVEPPPVELPPFDIGPTYLRQLTPSEYLATIELLFGGVPTGLEQQLPTALSAAGFDNNAEVIALNDAAFVQWHDAADAVALYAASSPERLAAVFTCGPGAQRRACLDGFVRRFGRLVFRRPLAGDEVDALVTLAAAQPEAQALDVRTALEAMLTSPSFLFRVEEGDAVAGDTGWRRLRPHELATRLSFLVQGRAPSEALLDAADRGELETPEGLRAAALELVRSSRAEDHLGRFASQWLGLPKLRFSDHPADRYPKWTEAARVAAGAEAEQLILDHLRAGGPFLAVLTARYGYLTPELAGLYGVAAPSAPGLQRHDWSDTPERGGLLTLAAVLGSTAKLEVTSPITRGLYVRMNLMCEPFTVPANVPPLAAATGPAQSERERLQRHRADPACAACHSKLEPLGFALSRYDISGVYRATDATGAAIDDSGSFDGFDSSAFRGARELSARLAASPEVRACAVRHFVRFAQGRVDRAGDERALAELAGEVFQTGDGRLQSLFAGWTGTDTFRLRRDPNREDSP